MSNEMWWAVMRSAGLAAWVFLTLTVVWGSIVSGRLASKPRARRWLLDLHPFLGALGLGALALHLVAAVSDHYVNLGWMAVVVPFASSWNPLGVAFGVVALWSLVVVEVTSLMRRRLGKRTWHRIHLASYAAAWLVTLHAATSGTDLKNPAIAWMALAAVAVTTGIAVTRSLSGQPAAAGSA